MNYLIFTQCTSFNIAALFRVIHEFLHSLGFQHEHTRPDRDQHITVNFNNVNADGQNIWKKHGYHEVHAYGSYDICSIMHYKDHGFVKRSGDTNIIIIAKPILTCIFFPFLFIFLSLYKAYFTGLKAYTRKNHIKNKKCIPGEQLTSQDIYKINRYYYEECQARGKAGRGLYLLKINVFQ